MRVRFFLFTVLTMALFSGCATKTNDIYYWNGVYETSMYQYLNEEFNDLEHISAMEDLVQKSYENNKKVAPGVYAHLGLLYMNQGNMIQANKNFNEEIKNFPESKAYIDFLRSSKNKRKLK